jgi:hypothetical protein
MSSSKNRPPPPPRQEMIDAVAEAMRELENLAPDPDVISACPQLPGIVLDRIVGKPLDRQGEEYQATINGYEKNPGGILPSFGAAPDRQNPGLTRGRT